MKYSAANSLATTQETDDTTTQNTHLVHVFVEERGDGVSVVRLVELCLVQRVNQNDEELARNTPGLAQFRLRLAKTRKLP